VSPPDETALVNWSVVLTNVSGLLIGSSILGILGGVGYMAFTLPQSQAQIIRNQELARSELTRIGQRVDLLEKSDTRQERDILRLQLNK
jgi:hypothetical protein